MRKSCVFALAVLIFVLGGTLRARAVDVTGEQSAALDIEGIYAEAPEVSREILGNVSAADAADVGSSGEKLLEWAVQQLPGVLREGAGSAALLISIVLLCALADNFRQGETDYVTLAGALAVTAAAAGNISAFLGLGRETLQTVSDFSRILLPSLAAAASAGGALTAGAAKYAASALFMDVLISAASGIIFPLIGVYSAAAAAEAALGNKALGSAADLIKWLCTTLMSTLAIVFTAYLSLTGIIADGADAAVIRVAKTTISTALPVVGSIVSDAAGSIASGMAALKNAMGIFGLLAAVCVCLGPFLTLGSHYLMYKAAAGISSALSDSRLSRLISRLGSAFGMILALVGLSAAMLFISVVSSLKAVAS